MLAAMNRLRMPKAPHRGWLMLMLVIISMRVAAGVPAIETPDHTADAHATSLFLLLEHGHDGSADDDTSNGHFHCHNGCAHAPMVVSSIPAPVLTKAAIDTSILSTRTTTSPASTHFRPPRA